MLIMSEEIRIFLSIYAESDRYFCVIVKYYTAKVGTFCVSCKQNSEKVVFLGQKKGFLYAEAFVLLCERCKFNQRKRGERCIRACCSRTNSQSLQRFPYSSLGVRRGISIFCPN